jgi:hypothetical protein
MALALVMPGPNEPGDYALEQLMEPLIEELLQLKQGKYSLVASIYSNISFRHLGSSLGQSRMAV